MKKILFFLSVLFVFTACYKDENPDGQLSDEFYLRHEGTDMPVWVRGNDDKETFIIFLHGGPLLSGVENAVYDHFDRLESDYAMVYYDQRGGGFTHGKRAVNLNEEQFVEDLEVLTMLIKNKYPQAKNLFLMGHSWGGYLATAFLKKGVNQVDFKGWIQLSGNHNFPLNWASSRLFGIDYAQNRIAENDPDKSVWEERLKALEETPEITNIQELRVINYIGQIIDREVNTEKNQFSEPSLLYLLSSPVGTGKDQKDLELLEDLIVFGDQSPNMDRIVLPTLLVYGGKDAIVPKNLGQNAYDLIGTPEEGKKLVILEESGHDIWGIEVDAFFSTVKDFVEEYK